MDFFDTAIKLFSAFIILIIYIKISGRVQLAPLSASDQVGNMVIGALVGSTIINQDVEVWEACVVVSMWAALQLLVRFVKYRSTKVTQIIDGKRILLIQNGKMLPDNFFTSKLLLNDFITNIHQQGVLSIQEINNAWLEPNGQITVDKKGDDKASMLIISNGSINEEELKQINKDTGWLDAELSAKGIEKPEDVFCAEWFDKKLYISSIKQDKE